MPAEVSDVFTQWAHFVLMWVGFGTLVGLLAKAILPGRDPGGALATVVIGILGSVLGAGSLAYFSESWRISPISPVGFVVAILGTAVLLWTNRLLVGRILVDGVPGFRGRRGRRISVIDHR